MDRHRSLILMALCVTLFTLPLAAQIPDKFENLQVLPKEIGKGELVSTMRGFASALGVRCKYCHVGPDNLQGMDFATDELQTKKLARGMLRMVQEINNDHIGPLDTSRETKVQVECKTCHRGIEVPAQIKEVIAATIEKDGLEAGLKRYEELREKYYGRAAYDFGPQPLTSLAESLFAAGKQDEALAVVNLANELNPDYAWSRVLQAGFHKERGETDKAIAAYQAALEIEPSNWVKGQLEALESAK